MIGIIDTGISNIFSLENSLRILNFKFISSNNPKKLKNCNKLILPGVGTFNEGMERLKKNNLNNLIYSHLSENKYLLGICLGQHLLMSTGFENGKYEGLNLIKGNVIKLKKNSLSKIPHIGWNEVYIKEKNNPLIKNIKNKSNFYFIHSYAVDLKENIYNCQSNHGINTFSSVINKRNIFGVQFHPEKSQINGLTVLSNFCKL